MGCGTLAHDVVVAVSPPAILRTVVIVLLVQRVRLGRTISSKYGQVLTVLDMSGSPLLFAKSQGRSFYGMRRVVARLVWDLFDLSDGLIILVLIVRFKERILNYF